MKVDHYRVGLLGAGYIADWHAQALRSVPNTSLVAVCDTNLGRARSLAERYRIPRVHGSLDELIADGALDAVHVLLPAERHHSAAIRLLGAGLHTLLEKPMCTTAEESDELIAAAEQGGFRIGVSHNFLFSEPYVGLKADLAAGRLGRPDQVTITWSRELGQVRAGPFDQWMLREPENVMLEIGVHSVSQALDLLGRFEVASVRASNPVDLPGGRRFYRRWRVDGDATSCGVSLDFSFESTFAEHIIHIRGSVGSATADLERNTYTLRRHTRYGPDFDRYRLAVDEAKALRSQARRNLARYALSTLKLADRGKPYGASIAASLRSFYGQLPGPPEIRLSASLGRDVIRLCAEIGRLAQIRDRRTPTSTSDAVPRSVNIKPQMLILGANGFIGRELTRQLVARGHAVRILVREPGRLPTDLRSPLVQIIRGDASSDMDLDQAMEGASCVYHLVRANVKTWDEYYQQDVRVTERIAEACLRWGVRRLIYTGTIDSYYAGSRAGTITEQTPLDPRIGRRNKYARAKALSEDNLLRMHRERDLPVVIFRPGIVVGRGSSPYHWGVAMWSWGSVCQLWGDGNNPLPIVLVEDVAQALVLGLEAEGIEGESFNLVSPPVLNARQYLEELERCTGVEFTKIPTAPWKFYAADMAKWAVKQVVRHPDRQRPSYRDWESRTQQAVFDGTKAQTVLGWAPTCDREVIIRRGIYAPAEDL